MRRSTWTLYLSCFLLALAGLPTHHDKQRELLYRSCTARCWHSFLLSLRNCIRCFFATLELEKYQSSCFGLLDYKGLHDCLPDCDFVITALSFSIVVMCIAIVTQMPIRSTPGGSCNVSLSFRWMKIAQSLVRYSRYPSRIFSGM